MNLPLAVRTGLGALAIASIAIRPTLADDNKDPRSAKGGGDHPAAKAPDHPAAKAPDRPAAKAPDRPDVGAKANRPDSTPRMAQRDDGPRPGSDGSRSPSGNLSRSPGSAGGQTPPRPFNQNDRQPNQSTPGDRAGSAETRKPVIPDRAGQPGLDRSRSTDLDRSRATDTNRPGAGLDRSRSTDTDRSRATDINRQPGPDRSRSADLDRSRTTDTNRPGAGLDRSRTTDLDRSRATDVNRQPGSDRSRSTDLDRTRSTDIDRPGAGLDRSRTTDIDRSRATDTNRQPGLDRSRTTDTDRSRSTDTNRPGTGLDRSRTTDIDRSRATDTNRQPGTDRSRTTDVDRARNTDANRPSTDRSASRSTARSGTVNPTRINAADIRNVTRNENLKADFNQLRSARNPRDIDRAFTALEKNSALRNDPALAGVNLSTVSGRFAARVDSGDFRTLAQTNIGRNINLSRQFQMFNTGDFARQLNLNAAVVRNGWNTRLIGPVGTGFTSSAFSYWYPGPSYYPSYVWMPQWSPWVSWAWWNTVPVLFDPRPWMAQPYMYSAAAPLVAYDFPAWQSLPTVASGTWVDVAPALVDSGVDLQLLAVRFVDPGHPDQDTGPRYRVWLRNNSRDDIEHGFDVTLVASNEKEISDQLSQAGVTVPSIPAEETVAVDIRLPAEANRLMRRDDGHLVPFQFLTAVVDGHEEIPDVSRGNNGAVLDRGDILPVDPAAFSTDLSAAAPGTTVTVAGEGFGPEPGEVIVATQDEQVPAPITGWFELGVQFKMPDLKMRSPTDAHVMIVRGDGAASNPVDLQVAPEAMLGELPEAPAPR